MNITVLSVTVFIALLAVVNAKPPSNIIGGTDSSIENQVSVRARNIHICGGTIISYYHIITAASCVTHSVGAVYANLNVFACSNDQEDTTENGKYFQVAIIIMHAQYDLRRFWKNDLSILKLATKIVPSTTCKPIFIPSVFDPKQINSIFISGWGGDGSIAFQSDLSSRYLQKMVINIFNHDLCAHYYEPFGGIDDSQVCAISTSPVSTYVTPGDGGGGIIAHKRLYGILSIVSITINYPLIFTKLSSFIDIIRQMVTDF